MQSPTRGDLALLLAVLAAIALALAGVLERAPALPEGAVASVNGRAIAAAELDARIEAVAGQLKAPPDAPLRAEIMNRVIDEELLLQQALALDLPRQDTRLRSQLLQQLIRQAVADSARLPVDEAELRAFHAAEAGFFTHPALYRVQRFDCPDVAVARRLQAALAAGTVADGTCTRRDAVLPDAWLAAAKLADYLGDERARAVSALAPGQGFVEEHEGAARLLWLAGMRPARAPAFDEVRAQVDAEFRRRRDEAALAAYLARLREEARVQLREDGG